MIKLDIPLPESCSECRLVANGVCVPRQTDSHTNRFKIDENSSCRPLWCPIQEVFYSYTDCEFVPISSSSTKRFVYRDRSVEGSGTIYV